MNVVYSCRMRRVEAPVEEPRTIRDNPPSSAPPGPALHFMRTTLEEQPWQQPFGRRRLFMIVPEPGGDLFPVETSPGTRRILRLGESSMAETIAPLAAR
jgi:hypothetical protein